MSSRSQNVFSLFLRQNLMKSILIGANFILLFIHSTNLQSATTGPGMMEGDHNLKWAKTVFALKNFAVSCRRQTGRELISEQDEPTPTKVSTE